MKKAEFSTIAEADIRDLRKVNAEDVFSCISTLQMYINRDAERRDLKKNDSILRAFFPDKIGALVQLTQSIRHTDAFTEVRDKARDRLEVSSKANEGFFQTVSHWSSAKRKEQKTALREHRNMYLDALRKETGLDIPLPKIRTFQQAETFDNSLGTKQLTNALFRTNERSRFTRSKVLFNTHSSSYFNDPFSVIGFSGHELVHAFQNALPAYLKRQPEALGHLKKDAELVHLMHKYNAYIPPKIPEGYKNIFLEKAAIDEQGKQHGMIISNFVAQSLIKNNLIDELTAIANKRREQSAPNAEPIPPEPL